MTVAAAATQVNPASGDKPAASTPAGDHKPAESTTPAETTTTTEKPGEQAAEKPASTADAPASKAPEKYALTLPENGRLDARDLALYETIARTNGWTNEVAQQRLVEHAGAVEAQSVQFTEDTKADAIYGGEHLADTLKHAAFALDKLRPKDTPRGDGFRALLDRSGYGSNLEVVSLLADLGKLMAEDGGATLSGGGAVAPKSAADVLYDAPIK